MRVKVLTLRPNQTVDSNRASIDVDRPRFLEDEVGSGRTFYLRGGEQFTMNPVAKLASWDELAAFVPPLPQKDERKFTVIVPEGSGFPLGRPLDDSDVPKMMQRGKTVAAQSVMIDASKSDRRQNMAAVGALLVMGACALAILVMVLVVGLAVVGGDDENETLGATTDPAPEQEAAVADDPFAGVFDEQPDGTTDEQPDGTTDSGN